MNTDEFRRTGTIPVIEAFEVEHPLKRPILISLALTVLLFGGWMLWRHFQQPRGPEQVYQEMRKTDPPAAIKFAIEQLKAAKNKEDARFWREVLAEHNLKSGKIDNAREHYRWLTKSFPEEEKYSLALKGINTQKKPPKKPPAKPPNKK